MDKAFRDIEDIQMKCRKKCGACCIAPSITTPFFGMPIGKPAGVKCIHLDSDKSCQLFGDFRRPALCEKFIPEKYFCGNSYREAYRNLNSLETLTKEDRSRKLNI